MELEKIDEGGYLDIFDKGPKKGLLKKTQINLRLDKSNSEKKEIIENLENNLKNILEDEEKLGILRKYILKKYPKTNFYSYLRNLFDHHGINNKLYSDFSYIDVEEKKRLKDIQNQEIMDSIDICILSQKHRYYSEEENNKVIDFLKILYKTVILENKNRFCITSDFKVINGNQEKDKYDEIVDELKQIKECKIFVSPIVRTIVNGENNYINYILTISNKNQSINYLFRNSGDNEADTKTDIILNVVINKGFPFFMETFALMDYKYRKSRTPKQILEYVKGDMLETILKSGESNIDNLPLLLFQIFLNLQIFYLIFEFQLFDPNNGNIMVYKCDDNYNQTFIINNETYNFNCQGYKIKNIDIIPSRITGSDNLIDFFYGRERILKNLNYDFDYSEKIDRSTFLTDYYNKYIKEQYPFQ